MEYEMIVNISIAAASAWGGEASAIGREEGTIDVIRMNIINLVWSGWIDSMPIVDETYKDGQVSRYFKFHLIDIPYVAIVASDLVIFSMKFTWMNTLT